MKRIFVILSLLMIFGISNSSQAQNAGILERMEQLLIEIKEVISKPTGTLPPPPVQPGPIISNVLANVNQTTVTISWSLNEAATGQVEYGTSINYGSFSVLEQRLIFTSHNQEISGLLPGTLYNFRVISKNAANQTTVSGNFTFTTPGGTVTPPPPPPPTDDPPLPGPSLPGTKFVAPNGDDSAMGTQAQPFRTIQKAVNVAQPGDVISAASGLYRERITFPNSGVADKPIILQGEPGAIINGADIVTGWTAAGGGVYSKPTSSFGYTPQALIWNDKQSVWQSDNTQHTTNIGRDSAQSWWIGRYLFGGNVSGVTYIRKWDNSNPNIDTVEIAPKNVGVVTLKDKNFITIRGFTIKNGHDCVRIDGGGNNVIERNAIQACANMIHLLGNTAANTIQDQSAITQNYVYEDFGHQRFRTLADTNAFDQTRVLGDLFGVGVFIDGAGSGNIIRRNKIFRNMAGIWIIGGTASASFNADTMIAENEISNCADYCLLLHQGTMAGLQFYDNKVHEFMHGIRFGPIRKGPVYIYRNRYTMDATTTPNPTNAGQGWFASLFNEPLPSTGIYVYHNTISIPGAAIYLDDCLANMYFINNIFSSQRFRDGGATCPATLADYNWIGGLGAKSFPVDGGHNKILPGIRLWPDGQSNLVLPPNSTAHGIGIDLSRPWVINGVTRPALPGMLPGYFLGLAPAAGAVQ